MLRLYEQTKPQEQQVSAAIKKRNRTKFRWGASSRSSSTGSGSTSSNSSTRRSSKGSTQASSSQSSGDPSHPPKASTRRSSLYTRPPRPKPTLSPIVESELEDHVSDDERETELEDLEHLLLLGSLASCCSSASSSLSLPAGSQYATLASPSSSASFTSNSNAQDALDKALDAVDGEAHNQHNQRYKPRVEYNLRKLLRQVMGLDGLWTCDQQVARHYARIKWGVVKTQADGNCLFRAISDQLYASEAFHGDIRRRIVDFIQREGTLFQPFLATDGASGETLEQYCARMRREGEWGGNPELYAAAKLFNIHVVVHQGPMRRVRIENGRENDPKTGKPPVPYKILHLLYKDDHYNSLRAPPAEDKTNIATAGHKDLKTKYKKAVALLDKISASKHEDLRLQEFAAAAAAVAKRDRSPVASPQHSRRQAKAHKSQDEPQDLGVPVRQTEAEAQAQADRKTPETEQVQEPVMLGTELLPAFEEASLSVAVSKPTRVTFRRGKAHSVCSSSGGDTEPESSSSLPPSAQPECPPRRKQSTEVPAPSPLFTAKAAQVLLVDTEENGPELTAEDELQASTRVVLPSRLKFHRGVQQQQQPQMTATAC